MDIVKEVLKLDTFRRFGVEIEVNAFDMRNRAIGYEDGALPEGIFYISNLVKKITGQAVLVQKWGNDHNNNHWIVKPDASCGMEIASPVLKGWQGLMEMCKVVDGFRQDEKIIADSRCSFHVHVDVSDLTEIELSGVLAWWIKCEAVFMDSVPVGRKKNQYCQLLGQTDLLDNVENGLMRPDVLFRKLGNCKYYSMNTFHYYHKKRRTIEFRIMDNKCCLNPWAAKNWTRLVLHFVEQAIQRGLPTDYHSGDQWSGYCWLDPIDVFGLLGFAPDQYELSSGLTQVRQWFLSQLIANGRNTGLRGAMSDEGRELAIAEVDQLAASFSEACVPDVYGDKFRV